MADPKNTRANTPERTAQLDTRRQRGRPRSADVELGEKKVKAVERALWALHVLAENDGMSLTDIATKTNVPSATLYRILVTLEAQDFIYFDPVDQLWHIGAGAFVIGSAFAARTQLANLAQPIMNMLRDELGETVVLVRAVDAHVMVIAQSVASAPFRTEFAVGTRLPLHATALGKALLAAWSEEGGGLFVQSSERTAFTKATLTSDVKLTADLTMTRTRGYAIEDGEFIEGVRAVGTRIDASLGSSDAALAIVGPSSRLSKNRTSDFGARLCEAAARISRALGGARRDMEFD